MRILWKRMMTLGVAVDSVMNVNGSKRPRTSHVGGTEHAASATAGVAIGTRRKLQTMMIAAVADHVNGDVMTGEKGAVDAVGVAHDCGSLVVEVRRSNTVAGMDHNWCLWSENGGDTSNICCRRTWLQANYAGVTRLLDDDALGWLVDKPKPLIPLAARTVMQTIGRLPGTDGIV